MILKGQCYKLKRDSKGFDKKGVELIYNKFNDAKIKWVRGNKVEVGDVFNPDLHEAISQIKAQMKTKRVK